MQKKVSKSELKQKSYCQKNSFLNSQVKIFDKIYCFRFFDHNFFILAPNELIFSPVFLEFDYLLKNIYFVKKKCFCFFEKFEKG